MPRVGLGQVGGVLNCADVAHRANNAKARIAIGKLQTQTRRSLRPDWIDFFFNAAI